MFLFALFHDSMRLDDGHDSEHGRRGWELAARLRDEGLYRLSDTRMEVLEVACTLHDEGGVSSDPRLGACWDADRLNLWRVGVRPNTLLLSTSAAKRAERIAWAKDLQKRFSSWQLLLPRFDWKSARISCSWPDTGMR